MANPLRIGIIGASAGRGWAKESHVPAVQKLAGLELAAVGTQDQNSADAAAKAFGAARGYGNADDLVRAPDIDVVAVAVKVPDHRALVLGALAAGKHVLCEWPLGRDVGEAEELRDAARAAGVHAVIGLQARMSPAVRRAAGLIRSGAIGRVLSARQYSDTIAFGPKVDAASLYLEDAANGATLLTIHGGHALDLAAAVLGGFDDVSALAAIQYPEIEAGSEDRTQERSIPDRVLVLSRLRGGRSSSGGGRAALSLEVAGGRPPADTRFRLEVAGETGTLALDGGAARGFQSGRIRLLLDGEEQRIDEGEAAAMPDTAANVAGLYAALRDDIVGGASSAPSFDHAVRLTRLVADVAASAETGARRPADDWPEE